MKNILSLWLAVLLLLAPAAFADTYETLPATESVNVWDTATGNLYAIGINGQGTTTVIPNAATANTWTGTNNFTGTFEIGGVAQVFPTSGLLVGRTDVQTLTNKTLTAPAITGGLLATGNIGIGTTAAASVFQVVGLGTSAPIGTTAGAGYVCRDSAGNFYQKATCP
jgi:hypothetical protein